MINENELPQNWEIKKLGEVCDITTGRWDANHSVVDGEYRFYTCAYDYLYCNTFRFSGECIILPGNGANVGEVFFYNGKFDAYQRTYVIQNIKILPKYLFYHLKLYWKKGTDAKQYGSATNYIRIGNFLDYDLQFPPLAEQERIVAKIEELFSELDAGLESLKTAQAQLKTYRQAVLKYAFEGKLTNDNVNEGELPNGWKWETLSESLTKIEAGKSFKCDERPPRQDEIGIVKVSAVTWGEFDENESKTIFNKEQFNENYLIEKGDFLFSQANTIELVGACVIVKTIDKRLMLSDKTLRFIFNENIKKEFALYYLRSRLGRKEIESHSTGNQDSMRNIGQAKIKQIQIPIPTLEEQQRIVEEIESRLSVCDKLEETINASLKQAEALRQSILKQAFEGKLIKPKEIEKPKRTPFYQMQTLGLIVDRSKQRNIRHGEMTLAKYAFLADKIYGVPIYENYQRWHLGPYPTEIKKTVNNREYFKIENNTIQVLNEEKLFKYNNDYKEQIETAVDELAEIFLTFELKDRSHKTELLATVCKVIEDVQTTEIEVVRQSMTEWKIDLKDKRFNNKAEKFDEEETAKCVKFIIEKGWDKKLIIKPFVIDI